MDRIITAHLYDYGGEIVYTEELSFKKFLFMKFLNQGLKQINEDICNIDVRRTINEINKISGFQIKSVIVSDDELILRESYFDTLTRLCHYVEIYPTADEALLSIIEEPSRYDIVLTDNMMPESVLNGVNYAKKVKELCPRLKVHIITGEISSVDKDVFDHNIDNTIAKPLNEYTFAITLGKGKTIRVPQVSNVIQFSERKEKLHSQNENLDEGFVENVN